MFQLQSALLTMSPYPIRRQQNTQRIGGRVKLPSPPHFPPSLPKPLLYANTAKKQEITEVASIENLMIKA